jgi:Flp pilus assembly protein TadG
MDAKVRSRQSASARPGVVAVEFAVCLPLLVLFLTGLWEVSRIVQISQIMCNAARESARDASLGQDTLSVVATNALAYLQGASQTGFGVSDSTTLIAPVVTLPSNTTGYTCWDNTAGRELFTITFTDLTNTTVTDPTGMSQLDLYQIGLQIPYKSIAISPVTQVTGMSRLTVSVTWACMIDSPFTIPTDLPAE